MLESTVLTCTIRQAAKIVMANVVAGISTMIFGQPGLGKTTLARAIYRYFAAREKFSGGCYVWSTSEKNAIDSAGLYRVIAMYFDAESRKAVYLQDCEIDAAIEAGHNVEFRTKQVEISEVDFDLPCFFCIDEFADCPVYEQSSWYRLLLEHTLGSRKLAEGSYVMACSNRPEDNAAARRVSTAALDRCCCLTLRADWRSVADYGRKHSWSDSLVSFISAYGAEVIDNGFDSDDAYGGSTPRGFERVHKLEREDMLSDDAEIELLQLTGNIGESAARKYQTFKQLQLPSPQLVFDSPAAAPVFSGDEKDKQFAYCAAIVSAASDDAAQFKAIVEYALRLDRVAGCAVCWDLKTRFPSFRKSASWATAVVEFSELLDA